ncbi:MAG: hypothetical protein DHS20C21_22200 [Gemmatimonadota bacterium]|nr:MAG: hypothetical protein DHS20C21_22200 [Gemmatimonadota bacterium]
MRPDEMQERLRGSGLFDSVRQAFERRGEPAPPSVHADYVRWKPDSCLVGLGSGGDFGCDLGYLKIFEEDDALVCVEKYRAREKGAGWVEHLPEWNAALFRFPLDRSVAGLGTLADMAALKHVLHGSVHDWSPRSLRVRARKSTVHMIKYKPERRGLARVDIALRRQADGQAARRTVVAQAYAEPTGATVHQVLSHLSAWTSGGSRFPAALIPLKVPVPLGYESQRRILIQEWVEGVEWGECLGTPLFDQGCLAAATALRELRNVPPPPGLESVFAWDGASRVLNDLAGMGDPALRRLAGELAEGLRSLLAQSAVLAPRLIHGDFHYHQILLQPESGQGTLIDWDEARLGDPREDPGNLLAHFHLLELDGRVSPAEGARLRDLFVARLRPQPDLPVFTALQLSRLALVPFRNLRADWRRETMALLTRVGEILESEGARS